jgi:antirestriction protein ArdC
MSENNRRTEILEQLSDGIARLTSSETWQQWLDIQSRFHTYSFGNTLLILRQAPEATRVAGFHAWRKLGRNVRKGEKAIWILAPMVYKSNAENAADADEATKVIRGFKPVPVFDVAQTDGEELPEIVHRLDGEDVDGIFTRLLAVAGSIGYTVEDATFLDTRNGDCTYSERRIRIAEDRSPVQRVKTLAHELAHAMLHEGHNNRPLAELEAESVAYVVCRSLGIESDEYSLGYVATWAGGGDEAIAAIKASGGRIQQTADTILGRLDQVEGSVEAAA